jgi:hypothetical protein
MDKVEIEVTIEDYHYGENNTALGNPIQFLICKHCGETDKISKLDADRFIWCSRCDKYTFIEIR